jgi:hypothetical protein
VAERQRGGIALSIGAFEAQAAAVPSFVDLQSRFAPVRHVDGQRQHRSLSALERLAVVTTDRVGWARWDSSFISNLLAAPDAVDHGRAEPRRTARSAST